MKSFWCLSITYLAGCRTSRESGDLAQTCIEVMDKPHKVSDREDNSLSLLVNNSERFKWHWDVLFNWKTACYYKLTTKQLWCMVRGDTVFVIPQQIKPKPWTLPCKLWPIIITDLHVASEESSSLLRDHDTKLNFSPASKPCCSGRWLYPYFKWSPAVSMQIPMARNSPQHFTRDTSTSLYQEPKKECLVFKYLCSSC